MHKKLLIVLISIFTLILAKDSIKGENYIDLANKGAWCWFQDPRGIYLEDENKIIAGYVDASGSIKVSELDLANNQVAEHLLKENLQKDDHAAPAFVKLPNNKIMAFYSAHNGREMYYRLNQSSKDLSQWGPEKTIPTNIEGQKGYCYPNPVLLSEEGNRLYLFWRGGTFKPTFAYSDDYGENWEAAQTLIQTDEQSYKRPYLKVFSNGKDKIHFAFTDGHPRDCPLNSIYYMYYQDGKFFKAGGNEISSIDDLPIKHDNADLVYDATKTKARAWIWDVTTDHDGKPVLVYTWLKEETKHIYCYARWDGKEWKNYKITGAGQAFPRPDLNKEDRDPEPHYSGGIYLNHNDPNIVYLSKPHNDRYEIEKWWTENGGKKWLHESITQNSYYDNSRPVYIENSHNKEFVLWMNGEYRHYTDYQTSIKINRKYEPIPAEISQSEIMEAMARVADWQMENPGNHHNRDWTKAALFKGFSEFARIHPAEKYMNYVYQVCEANEWKLGDRKYHADDHCIGQTYINLYRKYQDPEMIKHIQQRFNWILDNQPDTELKFGTKNSQRRWNWCDAIFMSPTVWAQLYNITGDKKYFNYLKKELNATTDYLYDEKENLYFRDSNYFDRCESNCEKVFWGRGNGWVLGGLTEIIENTKDRKWFNRKYVKIYQDMSRKIASLQGEEGYWHASLLDPESYPAPETSCSGFFCYGLAWGINNGYLDKEEFFPVVKKSWQALVKAVHPNGKLGYVQQIGKDPRKTNYLQTEVYGVGAFLLAGTEMLKLAE